MKREKAATAGTVKRSRAARQASLPISRPTGLAFKAEAGRVAIVRRGPVDEAGAKRALGWVDLATGKLSETAASRLSDAEKTEVAAWVEKRRARDNALNTLEARLLAGRIAEVRAFLKQNPGALSADELAETHEAMRAFMRQTKPA
jgi:hypothetical protein